MRREGELTLAGFRQRTVESWLNEWLMMVKANVASGQYAVRTYTDYEMGVRVHIVPYLGRTRIADLGEAALWKWTTALAERGLSPRTVQKAFYALSYSV